MAQSEVDPKEMEPKPEATKDDTISEEEEEQDEDTKTYAISPPVPMFFKLTLSSRGIKRNLEPWEFIEEHGTIICGDFFSIDVEELPKSLIISAEMPGLKFGSLELKVSDNDRMLTITGEKDLTLKRTKHAKVVLNEIKMSVYERNLYLPEIVDVNSITSTYSDGILRLEFTKKASSPPKKTVPANKRGCVLM